MGLKTGNSGNQTGNTGNQTGNTRNQTGNTGNQTICSAKNRWLRFAICFSVKLEDSLLHKHNVHNEEIWIQNKLTFYTFFNSDSMCSHYYYWMGLLFVLSKYLFISL